MARWGFQASGKGPSSYTAQLPTPTGRSVQQGAVALDRSDFTGQPNSPRVKFGIQNIKVWAGAASRAPAGVYRSRLRTAGRGDRRRHPGSRPTDSAGRTWADARCVAAANQPCVAIAQATATG